MKVISLVILILLGVGFVILYEGQKGKIRMHDDAKSKNEEVVKDKIRMYDDIKPMKEELLQKVPVGSSIQDAKRIMEENGFACEMYTNASFTETVENDPLREKNITHNNADFCYCGKRGTPIQLVFREWKVAIVHKNNVVSDIFVSTNITGP